MNWLNDLNPGSWLFLIIIACVGIVAAAVAIHSILTDTQRLEAQKHAVTKRVELELARVSAREFITVNVARDLMLAAMHKARSHEAALDAVTVQALLSDRPR